MSIRKRLGDTVSACVKRHGKSETETSQTRPAEKPGSLTRRNLVKTLAAAPILGGLLPGVARAAGGDGAQYEVDGISGATPKDFEYTDIGELEGELSKGRIGDLELSRMLLGGNMMGGWAHSRDLIYVSDLMQNYNTDRKVFETLRLAELAGINTILTNPVAIDVINRYWDEEGGAIQFISDCGGATLLEGVQRSIDGGAQACFTHGGMADTLAEQGDTDTIGEAVELIREHGVPAGIGAHKLETLEACVDAGIIPDFWMKTFHKSSYWSYTPQYEHDNVWDLDPEATAAYMEGLEQPWIAFKILAAGAVPPDQAFRWAFENGADFICVGMFDWQVVDNMNLAAEVLGGPIERTRPWRAALA